MSHINSLNGPRVQPPTTTSTGGASRVGFGSLLQGSVPTSRPSTPSLTGGQVVASALASANASPGSAFVNAYQSAATPPASSNAGTQEQAAQSGTPGLTAEEEKQMVDIAMISAATLANSILAMNNAPKTELEKY